MLNTHGILKHPERPSNLDKEGNRHMKHTSAIMPQSRNMNSVTLHKPQIIPYKGDRNSQWGEDSHTNEQG